MIEVLNLPEGDIFKVCPELGQISCFADFAKKDSGLPTRETLIYVYLLYSKGSKLNQKPIEDLSYRRVKAAKLAGFDPDEKIVIKNIFGIEPLLPEQRASHSVLDDLIADYLIHQSSYAWSDRCAIETQMDENLRIRLKPIESDKGDKDIIEASSKKFLLTEHFSKYKDTLKKLDMEIFIDHEDKRDHAVRRKTSLESLIK